MSNTKIVIDKDDLESFVFKCRNYVGTTKEIDIIKELHLLIKHATEIQIDQSIEERAESKAKDIPSEHYALIVKEAIVQSAKEQQIIEQLRVKEKEYKSPYWKGLNNL